MADTYQTVTRRNLPNTTDVTYQSQNLCYIYLFIKGHTEPLDFSLHRSLDTTHSIQMQHPLNKSHYQNQY